MLTEQQNLLLLSKWYAVPGTSGSSRCGLGPDELGALRLQSREEHLPQSHLTVWCFCRRSVGKLWGSDPHELPTSARQQARSIKNPLSKRTVAASRAACVGFSGSYKARGVFYTLLSAHLCLWVSETDVGVCLLHCSKGFRGGLERGFQP